MEAKTIWFINDYAGSPYHGMEYRHYYLAKELVGKNYDISIISSSYSHLLKNLPDKSKENIDGIKYFWLKTFDYGSAHSKKRVLKWFLFSLKLFFFKQDKSPNTIIVSTAAPFAILPAYFLSKKYNAKLIFEVKDIWPLSLMKLGGYSVKHPFIRLMAWFERFALEKSDVIVSNLQNYGAYISDLKINRKFYWISNGVDIEEMDNLSKLDNSVDEMIPKDKFIVGYAGTIGTANALDSLLESAKLYRNNNDIVYVIVGDGKEKDRLRNKYNFDNIIYLPSVSKVQVQNLLQRFDLCFIAAKKEKLYRFGVSPNKLFDYMYSARPILYAIESGKNIVDIAKCGLSISSEDANKVFYGIDKIYKMSEKERDVLGQNGKNYVLKHFTYKKLAKKLQEIL